MIGPLTYSNICKFRTLSCFVFSRLFPCFGSHLHQFSTEEKRVKAIHSGAPAKGRQAEPHTHMGKKRKPINEFSHGYHG